MQVSLFHSFVCIILPPVLSASPLPSCMCLYFVFYVCCVFVFHCCICCLLSHVQSQERFKREVVRPEVIPPATSLTTTRQHPSLLPHPCINIFTFIYFCIYPEVIPPTTSLTTSRQRPFLLPHPRQSSNFEMHDPALPTMCLLPNSNAPTSFSRNHQKQTLPKAQRTRGLNSSFQSNFLKSYQVLLHKS